MGKRLGQLTHNNTKCMLEVNGIKLIDRAMASLKQVGVERIIMVVGYKSDNVKHYLGDNYSGIPIHYILNPVYDKTNNIYSLFLAREQMTQDDTILMESDIIFDTAIMQKLVDDPFPNIALVDHYESWMEGTMVTIDQENRITRIIDKNGFRFDEASTYFKTVNIYKFSKEFARRYYIPFLDAYTTAVGNNAYYEQVLRIILHLHEAPLKALALDGESWYEIDDIQDLDIASSIFAATADQRYSAVASRFGGYWRYPKMLDFCYLVNPYFPPQRLVDELKANFDTLLRQYPSGMRVNSLLASRYFDVEQDYIVVGNGAAELIKAYMENHVARLGIVLPSFEEYPNRLPLDKVVPYTPPSDDFHYSAADIKAYFNSADISTLLIINPDNPSGNYIPYADLLDLIAWGKGRGVNILVDESFVDFAKVDGNYTLFDDAILQANPHLVVVKSISKSFGVPGLRLGVLACGDASLIAILKKEVAIWSINSFAEYYLQIYHKYSSDYRLACQQFMEERELFFEELQQVPYLQVFPSQANYFLCKLRGRFTSHQLALELLKAGILIKDCSTKKAFAGANYIRIAIRDRHDNNYLVQTLKSL